jgi:hypothetical protein
MPEERADAIDDPLGECVLDLARRGLRVFHRDLQNLGEENLGEAVTADDAAGTLFAGLRQHDVLASEQQRFRLELRELRLELGGIDHHVQLFGGRDLATRLVAVPELLENFV